LLHIVLPGVCINVNEIDRGPTAVYRFVLQTSLYEPSVVSLHTIGKAQIPGRLSEHPFARDIGDLRLHLSIVSISSIDIICPHKR
jgi:hypothetical protein